MMFHSEPTRLRTERALGKVKTLMNEAGVDQDYFVRVAVEGGGCSGLTYKLDFDNEQKEGDQIFEDSGGYEDYLAEVIIPHPETYDDDYQGRDAARDAWMRIDGHMNRKDVKIKPPQGLSSEELSGCGKRCCPSWEH